MKWQTKIKPQSQLGELRTVERFALFPRKLDDGYTVWLEIYNVDQKYWPDFYSLTDDIDLVRRCISDTDMYPDEYPIMLWREIKTYICDKP